MSRTRSICVFLLIAVLVSVALAYAGAAISLMQDEQRFDLIDLLFTPLALTPIYAAIVIVGGLVFGLPSLILLRKLHLTGSRIGLCASGASVGAIASSAILVSWHGLAVLTIAMCLGAIGGAVAALLWFELVERHITYD